MTGELGLRQRKRIAAMRRIQEAALGLFDERGFADVTVEEIADAADVSPSSVYRYFGSKEQVVLRDEFEPEFFDALRAELADGPPVEAMRRAVAKTLAAFLASDDELARRRTRYALEEPRLRAAWAEGVDELARLVAATLAEATGREEDELEVQVTASALVWALVAAVRRWHAEGYAARLDDELDRALDVLERGLRP